MPLEDLLETATSWLVKGGAVSLVITLVAFIAKWGLRFRLVGVTLSLIHISEPTRPC